MKITNLHSPNFDKKKRLGKSIKFIVIHYTGMQSERAYIHLQADRTQFLINRNGKIFRLVHDNQIAWHAGISCWKNYKNLNKNSVGIELVNKGHEFGYTNFSKKQLLSLIKICKKLIKKYQIKKSNIVGHSDIAPLRKVDPGEKFPWAKLAKNQIGIWHNCKSKMLKKYRKTKLPKAEKKEFTKNMKNIGYCLSLKKRYFFVKVMKSFQMHYRKELIDGILDKECSIIAQNLSKHLKKQLI